jgi:dienelactone hydrolase
MASVVLFHSVMGLRPVELAIAETLRAAGHDAWTPDLYEGLRAKTIEDGIKLKDEIGWDRVTERAIDALEEMPDSTVLAGISMGCGVITSAWPRRPETKGVLLLHALAGIPAGKVRNGLPLQLHIGADDQHRPADEIGRWSAEAQRAEI